MIAIKVLSEQIRRIVTEIIDGDNNNNNNHKTSPHHLLHRRGRGSGLGSGTGWDTTSYRQRQWMEIWQEVFTFSSFAWVNK
jgi:hypothetical protein